MEHISNQQVAEYLKCMNPWWDSAWVADEARGMRPRAYLQPVREILCETALRRAVVLLGSRRVGKTVLIQHLITSLLDEGIAAQRVAYVAMESPLLRDRPLAELVKQIEMAAPGGEGNRYLFFDEIQSHKDWEIGLKLLVGHRPDLRILVSGSVAATLKRQSAESGAGRFTDFLLPPLTFYEYLHLLEGENAAIHEEEDGYVLDDMESLNKQFVDYVQFGGYPELMLSPVLRGNPARFVNADIVGKVLSRDLPQLYGIGDIRELNTLFMSLAFNTAGEVSIEQLSQESGVNRLTIQKYIEYLEAAFLVKRVFRIGQDGRRYQRVRNFKVYLSNPSMYTGLFGAPQPESEKFGRLVETALFAQHLHERAHLNYARWGGQGYEVDLVESSPALKPVSALEIKWSDRHVNRLGKLKGLMKFVRENRLQQAWVSTRSQFGKATVIDGAKVRQWPAAILAFHYGINAVRGRLADFNARVKNVHE